MEASDTESEDPLYCHWDEDHVGEDLSKKHQKAWELRMFAYANFFEQYKIKKVKLDGRAKKPNSKSY
jgi:hypothetical protein